MISGKAFADKCTWVVDPRYPDREPFVYTRAQDGDWVFVNGDYLQDFLKRLPFLRTKRFTVIVHNTDHPFGPTELYALLPSVYRIYAVNCAVLHPQVTPIPLGFVDKQLPLLPGFKGGSSERPIEAYMNFLDRTNAPKRTQCRAALANDPRITQASDLSVPEYFMDLGRSKFVICPEGTGVDTHRVYESLLCGATPVVLHSVLDRLYERLPVCIVNAWTDPFTVPSGKSFPLECAAYL
jgi:hypothetical protein